MKSYTQKNAPIYEALEEFRARRVVPFDVPGLRVPHIGWNQIDIVDNPLFQKEDAPQYVYFVHSYHGASVPQKNVIATASYGYDFVAAVREGNLFGTQFHPEKSGEVGLGILKAFCEL